MRLYNYRELVYYFLRLYERHEYLACSDNIIQTWMAGFGSREGYFVWVLGVGVYAGYMGSGKYVSVGIDTILDQDTEVLGHDTDLIN